MKITLIKSLIGRHPDHVKTAKSMNLKKIGDVSEQPDNAATKGKIAQITYLLKIENN